jgi:proteic killer suppression protein
MIRSFRDKRTEAVDAGTIRKGFPAELVRRAQQLLTLIDAARSLDDLRSPPGNRLEKLSGDREGQHSVRINVQWRICFIWKDGDAEEVEIVDYY